MTFLLANWKAIFIAVILAGLGGSIFFLNEELKITRFHLQEARSEIESIKAQSIELKKYAEIRNAEIAAFHEQQTKEIVNDYAQTVAAISHRDNVGISCRMRKPADSNSGSVPSPSQSAGRVDATSPDSLAVENLPKDCARTTAIAIGLQKFVREECAASALNILR